MVNKQQGGTGREQTRRRRCLQLPLPVFTTATSGDSTSLADLHSLSQTPAAASRPPPPPPPSAPGYALRERQAPIGRAAAKLRGFAGGPAHACAVAGEPCCRALSRARLACCQHQNFPAHAALRCGLPSVGPKSQPHSPQSRPKNTDFLAPFPRPLKKYLRSDLDPAFSN